MPRRRLPSLDTRSGLVGSTQSQRTVPDLLTITDPRVKLGQEDMHEGRPPHTWVTSTRRDNNTEINSDPAANSFEGPKPSSNSIIKPSIFGSQLPRIIVPSQCKSLQALHGRQRLICGRLSDVSSFERSRGQEFGWHESE